MNSNTLIIMITIIIDDKIAIIVISKNAHVYYSTNSYHDSYKLLVSSTERGGGVGEVVFSGVVAMVAVVTSRM